MKILGIETSCDETSAAVVEDGVTRCFGNSVPETPVLTILSNIVASQVDLHERFGGVVPEVASRRHVELILPTIQQALDDAGCKLSDIECIGVINRPGLIGALIVGAAAAKSIAFATGLPLVAVHHLEAHIYANWLTGSADTPVCRDHCQTRVSGLPEGGAKIDFPVICLVVSGGHSDIIYMRNHGDYETIARTRDDAAGEAFDKCARVMGLGYPGGPLVDNLARDGNPKAVAFPRPKVGDTLDFSFSGLKTAVIRHVEGSESTTAPADLAASMQQAVVDVLVDHTLRAAQQKGVETVLVAGGVAANSKLQADMRSRAERAGLNVIIPPPVLCTDNAAMAASAAYFNYIRGNLSGLSLDCFASEPLGVRA